MEKGFESDDFFTVGELAQMLKVPVSWIYGRTRQRGPNAIPVVRCGKYCRFHKADVLNWLKKQNEAK
jgi:excisionase family DNA binding protein